MGFPGPEHVVAEHAWPMKFAMSILAVLAIVGGALGIPGVTDTLEHFLEPTFEDSRYISDKPTDTAEWEGLGVGGIIGVIGISLAFVVFVARRGLSLRLRDRFSRLHGFLSHKWYFDELFDRVIVRPFTNAGSFGRRVIETDFVQGVIVGGTTGVVRAGTSVARAIQTGYLRAYALVLLFGVAGLGLYFLIASS